MGTTLGRKSARVARRRKILRRGGETRPVTTWRRVTVARQRTGRLAEELVARRLSAAGWEVLERNARTRHGELDLVALDGRALVFVEVKAGRLGSPLGPERPILAVDRRKQRRVRRLATAWMAERRRLPPYEEIRFDAVGVTFDRHDRPVDVEHIKSAF
jgi:putative endonuclease